jgi:hypothetical protein
MRLSAFGFISPINPHWSLMIRLKYFDLILSEIFRNIRRVRAVQYNEWSRLLVVLHSAKSTNKFLLEFHAELQSVESWIKNLLQNMRNAA